MPQNQRDHQSPPATGDQVRDAPPQLNTTVNGAASGISSVNGNMGDNGDGECHEHMGRTDGTWFVVPRPQTGVGNRSGHSPTYGQRTWTGSTASATTATRSEYEPLRHGWVDVAARDRDRGGPATGYAMTNPRSANTDLVGIGASFDNDPQFLDNDRRLARFNQAMNERPDVEIMQRSEPNLRQKTGKEGEKSIRQHFDAGQGRSRSH